MTLQKLVSAGETGIERAALRWAQSSGIEIGGWRRRVFRPKEADQEFALRVAPGLSPLANIACNVRDSDASLILYRSAMDARLFACQFFAQQKFRKPVHVLRLAPDGELETLHEWLLSRGARSLHVIGERQAPGACEAGMEALVQAVFPLLTPMYA